MAEKYPECEKLSEVAGESQRIGEFIDWLGEQEISLTESRGVKDEYGDEIVMELPIRETTEKLLARYFDIDLNKVEEEKQQILDSL